VDRDVALKSFRQKKSYEVFTHFILLNLNKETPKWINLNKETPKGPFIFEISNEMVMILRNGCTFAVVFAIKE
jgi:hypothetical protein